MKMKRKIYILLLVALVAGFFWLVRKPTGLVENSDDIKWGVAFSKMFATEMGLDWREVYLATIDDLKVERMRLPIYWQDVEPEPGKYSFDDYDWMIEEAKKRNVELILVIGRKLPRWPECHAPFWADKLPEQEKQEKILAVMRKEVERYKDIPNLYLWQVDNEPFLPFGKCTTTDKGFLDEGIGIVRRIDPNHKIMVTDSGELSIWVRAAKRADIFGTTMYRIIYKDPIGYFKYPLPPKFFWLKANIVHLFYPGKPIVVSELQAEPWGPKLIYDLTLEEQKKSMSLAQFRENIEYAKRVGFPENYLWGAEWWYWLKTKHNHPEIWEAAKEVINNSNK
ncbi:MAG: cellulase family glycosylhydrolase [Patescibacteria group bacterium]|nr:cellulase family glycosylhydrolase [Patescibacteria group bacterium]